MMEWYWTGLLCIVVFIIGRWSGRENVDRDVNRAFFDGYDLGAAAGPKVFDEKGHRVK